MLAIITLIFITDIVFAYVVALLCVLILTWLLLLMAESGKTSLKNSDEVVEEKLLPTTMGAASTISPSPPSPLASHGMSPSGGKGKAKKKKEKSEGKVIYDRSKVSCV